MEKFILNISLIMCAKLNETNVTSKVFALNIIYMTQQQRKYIEKDGLKKIFLSIHLIVYLILTL